MAITTMAQVLAALPGQSVEFQKTALGGVGAVWYSPWGQTGQPGAGADPSSGLGGNIPTSATAGAFPLVNAGAGNQLRLGRWAAATAGGATGLGGTIFLYDRLWHNSGIDRTLTTGQTINSTALTRPDANGEGVEAWWQVYVAMGTGTPTVTLAYTDQDGNTAQSASSGALTASMGVGRTGSFNLASGDTGVRSIQTWTGSVTFGTSGTIGLVLRRQIAAVGGNANINALTAMDAVATGLPRIYDDACLELLYLTSTTTAHSPLGYLSIVQG